MSESHEHFRIAEAAALSRKRDPAFASWATGYGVIEHDDVTQVRVYDMAGVLVQRGAVASRGDVYRVLAAADRLANEAMWLVVHMTYARNVYLDGRELDGADFKTNPEGHTGGALNVALAWVSRQPPRSVSTWRCLGRPIGEAVR